MSSRCILEQSGPVFSDSKETIVLMGRKQALKQPQMLALLPDELKGAFEMLVNRLEPGDHGRTSTLWQSTAPECWVVSVLPENCSRHNAPSRAWAIKQQLESIKGNVQLHISLTEPEHAIASGLAASRTLQGFHTNPRVKPRQLRVWLHHEGRLLAPAGLQQAMDSVQQAAIWVDQPPNLFNVDQFVAAAQRIAKGTGSSIHIVRGAELVEQGMGGIWGVGKASEQPPALIVLDHRGSSADAQVWVGKGITYDTGGLSIKSKTGMPGMKTDMGGAAAVLAAFEAAAKLQASTSITAVLCVAENAVGPASTRPDDVLKMYSGKTVEVNNTDAEGRLVLADGVAWAAKNRDAKTIIDLATLTGAQMISTGKLHAAAYCNNEDLEQQAVTSGKWVGDLVHPMPYAPELFRKEFGSVVADMKNSVKDRSNAQSSCAGQFINNHLQAVSKSHKWLHLDMCGPAVTTNRRGTGWGVGLLLALAGVLN